MKNCIRSVAFFLFVMNASLSKAAMCSGSCYLIDTAHDDATTQVDYDTYGATQSQASANLSARCAANCQNPGQSRRCELANVSCKDQDKDLELVLPITENIEHDEANLFARGWNCSGTCNYTCRGQSLTSYMEASGYTSGEANSKLSGYCSATCYPNTGTGSLSGVYCRESEVIKN